ncbi:3'-5' exonuclease [Paraburkholderia diazotrophica]|uniref:DNA 3'-5' helicase n=1 Tax=Paraburkholderia diazotrophica TaxID=667676 RepID=A0A1H7EER6_9BURK|nr:3'-5' exonuclease [Paraburkholderia diazotrophica]SEK12446.1 UvrD/REP helicase N-terminal domain-containing protein [Paraburkholderia diazotrophica]
MPRSFTPTAEQEAALRAVGSGGNIKVKAYAGAAKTSTLRLIANRLPGRRGAYLAFNREIAEYARREFPSSMLVRTMHSMAYGAVERALRERMSLPVEPPQELAARYGIGGVDVPAITGKTVEVASFDLGRMIVDGLGRFCRSADPEPRAAHIPVDEKIGEVAARWLQEKLLPFVVRHWHESLDPRGRNAISPDVVLKVWSQSGPRINADLILFDEAQDSDEVMLSVLGGQHHAQIVYVGDPYQQIYEWRGAVNAMSTIDAPETRLTKSFRFGPTLAGLASRILQLLGEKVPVQGQETIGSIVVDDPAQAPPVDAVLCRKNVTAIWRLAAGIESGHKPAIRMRAGEIEAFADGAEQLLAGRRAFRPAAFSLFETWQEVQSFARSAFGRDLLPVVQIVDERGTGYLRALARHVTPENGADYVISSIHRAKGLEYGRVRVINDFRFRNTEGQPTLDEEELRLLYVAVTRARHVLDISGFRAGLAGS